jgi:hypothetical protein
LSTDFQQYFRQLRQNLRRQRYCRAGLHQRSWGVLEAARLRTFPDGFSQSEEPGQGRGLARECALAIGLKHDGSPQMRHRPESGANFIIHRLRAKLVCASVSLTHGLDNIGQPNVAARFPESESLDDDNARDTPADSGSMRRRHQVSKPGRGQGVSREMAHYRLRHIAKIVCPDI